MIEVPSPEDRRWDVVSLGEVMLRLDPGDEPIGSAATFNAWEGGGEYNVAKGCARVFGKRAAVVTGLADNEVGRLVESRMRSGGVDTRHVVWRRFDGLGRSRVGLYFMDRGAGIRPPASVSDRWGSVASRMGPGDVDWSVILEGEGTRWLHTGGIFAGLSERTTALTAEAMAAARETGAVVSYDLNVRSSLWASGERDAVGVHRGLVEGADVLFSSIHDLGPSLGIDVEDIPVDVWAVEPERFADLARTVAEAFPRLGMLAVSLRDARSANRHRWGGLLFDGAVAHTGRFHDDLEVLDRVGGGDAFVAGIVTGLLDGDGPGMALELGIAHGALAVTVPGDTSTATRDQVLRAITADDARTDR